MMKPSSMNRVISVVKQLSDIYAVADRLYMLASHEAVKKLLRAILAPENKTRESGKRSSMSDLGG
jgi:hypothetical protein